MASLGIVTVGQTPRLDLTEDFHKACPGTVIDVVGALDGLSLLEIKALEPDAGEYPIRCPLRSGAEVPVGKAKMTRLIQACIDELERRKPTAIVLGCNSVFATMRHSVPLLSAGEIANGLVASVAHGLKLGCVVALPEQTASTVREFEDRGVACIALPASPSWRDEKVLEVVRALEAEGVRMIFLKCFGFGGAWQQRLSAHTSLPVVSPVLLTANVAAAFLA